MLFLFMNLIFIYVMKKKTNKIDVDFIPLTLPSENVELGKFIDLNKIKLMEAVIDSVEYAVGKNLSITEVFYFFNTDFIITINDYTFRDNVQHIYDYYIKNENYELCPRVVKLLAKLKNEKQKTS